MATINIKGAIISNNHKWLYDWLEMEATAPKDIVLPENGEPVEVIINSGGGDVYAGSEIYTALRSYEGDVTVKIVGIAASAASVIAMAGDVVEISPTAQLMIHNVSARVQGDHQIFAKESEVLKGYNQSIANSYVAKTGKSMEELLTLMGEETWFTAQKAVEHGFADKIMFAVEEAPLLVASASPVLSSEVLGKLANLKQMDSSAMDVDRLADKIAEQVGKVVTGCLKPSVLAESSEDAQVIVQNKIPTKTEQGYGKKTAQGLGRFCF